MKVSRLSFPGSICPLVTTEQGAWPLLLSALLAPGVFGSLYGLLEVGLGDVEVVFSSDKVR